MPGQTNKIISNFCRVVPGSWSKARPVFKKVNGYTRFLLVKFGEINWRIQSSTSGTAAYIVSGRGTNSPASPAAGPSVTEGVSRWRYWNGYGWREGYISVTCV